MFALSRRLLDQVSLLDWDNCTQKRAAIPRCPWPCSRNTILMDLMESGHWACIGNVGMIDERLVGLTMEQCSDLILHADT